MPEHPRGAQRIWRSWTRAIPFSGDPGALFASLYGGREAAVWLDSARRAYGMGRWSIMGAPETPRDHLLEATAGGRLFGGSSDGASDIWSALADRIDAAPVAMIGDLPFAGGYVGYVGYDAKVIGGRAPSGITAQLVHLSRFVALDHERGELTAVAVGPEADESGARGWLEETVARVAVPERVGDDGRPPAPRAGCSPVREDAATGAAVSEWVVTDASPHGSIAHPAGPSASAGPAPPPAAHASVTRERYVADLAEVRRWLFAGDSYEACYTYNLRFGFDGDALAAYRRLRRANPAPNAAFLRMPGREVLSCSPERFLRVDASGWAETKPIKGTARRRADPQADARAAADLAADPKTRAENLMIVDLLRNDLGRVSLPGTVEVPQLMDVESYETVHQLVTTVRAKLRPRGAAGVRAAEALFPPGSMTGAPKQRSVELLDGLEAEPRGVYSGVLGMFSRDGVVDLSVIIRTVVLAGGEATIGTGGAITVDSDPDAELEETIAKSDALLRAFGMCHPFAVQPSGA